MTSVNEFYGSEWLKAADLQGREHTVTIERWSINERPKTNQKGEQYTQKRIVLHFKGAKKKLELANINAAAVSFMHGDQLEDWIGKPVTLFPTKTQFGNDIVDCIRIKPPGTQNQIEPPKPNGGQLHQSLKRLGDAVPKQFVTQQKTGYDLQQPMKSHQPDNAEIDPALDDAIPF